MKNFIDLVDAQLMGEIVLDTERKGPLSGKRRRNDPFSETNSMLKKKQPVI